MAKNRFRRAKYFNRFEAPRKIEWKIVFGNMLHTVNHWRNKN